MLKCLKLFTELRHCGPCASGLFYFILFFFFFFEIFYPYLSRLKTKPTKWSMRPAKTQISLGIRPVWSESSLCAQWVAKDPSFLHADSEDSDQTGLIWVLAGRTCHFVDFVMRRLILGIGLVCHEQELSQYFSSVCNVILKLFRVKVDMLYVRFLKRWQCKYM